MTLDDWLLRFAGTASSDEQVQRFVDVVDGEILRQIPEIAGDPTLTEDLHRSTRFHWLGFLATTTQPGYQYALPAPAAALARSLARRGLDLGVLLKVYRAAHVGVFRYFDQIISRLSEDDPPADAVLRRVWHDTDLWINDSVEKLIETFYDEHRAVLEGAMARRGRTIAALLDGSMTDIDDAIAALGHNLRLWQSAFVVWADEEHRADALPTMAADLARALGAATQMSHSAGSRDLWCWVATPSAPEPDAIGAATGSAAALGLRVAAGTAGRGIDGFRAGHLEAVAVRRLCAAARPVDRPVVRYAEVDLLCIAAERPDLLRRLVRGELGPLCAGERNVAALRDTALTYLTERMNVDSTARRLFVHSNTVRYRIGRVEDLIGHPLNERPAHAELALRYLDLFGPLPDD